MLVYRRGQVWYRGCTRMAAGASRASVPIRMPRAAYKHCVDLKRVGAVLAAAHERQLSDFASALLMEKLGPRTLQSLAPVAEVIHGTSARFSDPARFSLAHGGKDRHPFPVPTKVYDRTIEVLETSLEKAKAGDVERKEWLARLHRFVLKVERELKPHADFERHWSTSAEFRTNMADGAYSASSLNVQARAR